MLKKQYIYILLSLMSVCMSAEAKPKVTVFKDAAAAIKNKNNLQNVRGELMKHAADSATSNENRARALAVAAEVNKTIYAVENEKLYLKKAYDTTAFYAAIFDLYNCVLKCDSVEVAAGGKIKYRKNGEQMLVAFRANLLNGGKWHMLRGRYKEAFSFFDLYMNTVKTAIHDFGEEEQRYKIAYWAVQCCYSTNNYEGTLQYVDSAMVLGVNGNYLQKFKVYALWETGDTAAWIKVSEDAMRQYPSETYFFVNLMDFMREEHRYDQAMSYAEEMIKAEPDTIIYRYSRSLLHMEQEHWKECIEASDDVIKYDSLYADAWYNKGLSYVKIALDFERTACLDVMDPNCAKDRNQLKQYYTEACTAMERLRTLRPDDKNRWAPSLYHIYLNLNMGREFGEMERILKE